MAIVRDWNDGTIKSAFHIMPEAELVNWIFENNFVFVNDEDSNGKIILKADTFAGMAAHDELVAVKNGEEELPEDLIRFYEFVDSKFAGGPLRRELDEIKITTY